MKRAAELQHSAVEVSIEKYEKTAMQWLQKQTKPIDNDVKGKYKTSPPQTCGAKGIPINRDFLLTCYAKCTTRREGIVKWPDFQEHLPAGRQGSRNCCISAGNGLRTYG